MAEIGRWNNHVFEVAPNVIRGFGNLTIKGSSETDEKATGGQKYVSRKNGNPAEVGITAILSALTGSDVRAEALTFVDEARLGAKGYFYIGGKKLMTCPLMLTDAVVSEAVIAINAAWISCEVKLTLKQCSKYDGESGGSGGKSTGKNGKSRAIDTAIIGAVAGGKAATSQDEKTKLRKEQAETAAGFNRRLLDEARKAAAKLAKKKKAQEAMGRSVKYEPATMRLY